MKLIDNTGGDERRPHNRGSPGCRAVWTTRDGEEIEVRNMETSHILNTIRFLARKAAFLELEDRVIYGGFDIEYSEILEADKQRKQQSCRYWANVMVDELKRRGEALPSHMSDSVRQLTE